MKRLYTGTKIFHWHEKLDHMMAGTQSAPVHVRLKPTNRCNQRCSYCCYRNDALHLSELMDERDEIPRDKMGEIVTDLANMGVRAVTLTGGGEPLCYPHILDTVRQLLDAGVKTALLTNAARLSGEISELLARRATWIRVSMDAADRDHYAESRGVSPAEFDRVCDNIRTFCGIDGRRCVAGINLVVTRENSGEVSAFLELAKSLGVDHVKVSNAIVSTDPGELAAYQAPFYRSVRDQIAQARSRLADERFAIVDKVHPPDSEQEGFERQYTRCPFARCLTVIAADQSVYTCQDKAYTSSGLLGSVRDRSFADLWSSEELQRRLSQLDPSRDCRHHCVAHGKNLMLLDYLEADQEHLDFV